MTLNTQTQPAIYHVFFVLSHFKLLFANIRLSMCRRREGGGGHNIGTSGLVPQWLLQQGRALLLIYGSQCKATGLYHPTENKLENDPNALFQSRYLQYIFYNSRYCQDR